jgi:DHA2 family multidrug resistance protein
MALGVALLCYSLWTMTGWTPDASQWSVISVTIIQGAGLGFVFIPLQVVAFATLPAAVRTDGTSLLSLFRNIGSAIGVSVTSTMLARNIQAVHADLVQHVTPFSRALQGGGMAQQMLNPVEGAAPLVVRGGLVNTQVLNMQNGNAMLLDSLLTHQATIIAYLDDFKLMLLTSAPTVLLLLLLRKPARTMALPADAHAAMD